MQQLLTNLCTNYIGIQYSKLIITLLEKPLSLQTLVQVSQESYGHLIQKLKYLIKLNVVTFDKRKDIILYSVDEQMILFFQRIVKYYNYVQENCTKQEARILTYFLEVLTSNFDIFIEKEGIKKQQIQRTKQVFAGLVKQGYLYEDEKAFDLKICQIRPQDIIQEKQQQLQKKDVQTKQKQSKSKPKDVKQTKQTGKRKKKITLEKNDNPAPVVVETKPAVELGIISKIENKATYFCISTSLILQKIKDNLIAERLKNKFKLNKTIKQIVQMINQEKFQYPFDFYNTSPLKTPKQNLLQDLQTELLEQFIYRKHGQNSLLVYKTLVDNQYVTQKNLGKLTRLELKELRGAINSLYVSGIAKSYQIKIERTNTMVFWVDPQLAEKEYIQFLSKTCLNLDLVIKRFTQNMHKQQSKGGKIEIYEDKLLRLEANLLQIDDCLILQNH